TALPELPLPAGFARATIDVYGEAGACWLSNLPAIVAEFAERWSLTLESLIEPLSYNYVLRARQSDGTPVVLEAGFPHPELLSEIDALRWYDGRGSARLLDCDRGQGIMLLERLEPGTPLASLADDEQATSIAA